MIIKKISLIFGYFVLLALSPIKSLLAADGTWFIIQNNCEDDETALVIAQEGSDLTFTGSFDYQEGVDSFSGTISDGRIRFTIVGTDSTARCLAAVSRNGLNLKGRCKVRGTQAEVCAFRYTNNVAGLYNLIDNNCEDDESPITITQDDISLSFTGGFDYPGSPDNYTGAITSSPLEPISFTIDGRDSDATCTANIHEGNLTGTCVVTGVGAETCDFAYAQ